MKVPHEALDVVYKRLRSKECGIGERIRILGMLGEAADGLANYE